MSKEFSKRLEALEMAAQVEVEKEFVRLVRICLTKNKKLSHAHALMGSVLWVNKYGLTVDDYNPKNVEDFLVKYDDKYCLTGCSYKIYSDVVLDYYDKPVKL